VIQSRIANILIALAGAAMIALPAWLVAAYDGSPLGASPFIAIGFWCLVGAVINLRSPAILSPLPTYRYAARAVFAFGLLFVVSAVGVYGLEASENWWPFEAALRISALGYLVMVVTTCAILLHHRVLKARPN
jgi:hypothetical protein